MAAPLVGAAELAFPGGRLKLVFPEKLTVSFQGMSLGEKPPAGGPSYIEAEHPGGRLSPMLE